MRRVSGWAAAAVLAPIAWLSLGLPGTGEPQVALEESNDGHGVSRRVRRGPVQGLSQHPWGHASLANRLNPQVASTVISGVVRSGLRPAGGAIVRVQGSPVSTRAAQDGSFTLTVPADADEAIITAWAPGYFIGWVNAPRRGAKAVIRLRRHYQSDNPDYEWFARDGVRGSRSCGRCMPGHFEEWRADAHSQSAVNPRFLTVYRGTDTEGNRSPATVYASSPDYARFPLPPDLTRPYYGPGYKLDFPEDAGNCGTCHIPVAAARRDNAYAVDPDSLTPLEKEGVSCEVCHKIGDVILDPATGGPYPNRPGVLSARLYRPSSDKELFFGTFDDVTRRVTYLPLQSESAFCAPCHFGVFWDTVIYSSYGEWLDSPYSDPKTGQTCQDCHMPVTGDTHFVLPEEGGIARPPGRIFNHRMPGAADVPLLQDTASLELAAMRRGDRVIVAAQVTNEKGGHHIPTDHPARQIILVVEAHDAQGRRLEHLGDTRLPWWTGTGDAPDDYAGRPGRAYAKILEETWTGVWPSIAYWNPTTIREDTRLPALGKDTSRYEFRAPADGGVTIEARLIFRRAFKDLALQKKWDLSDILMERRTLELP